MATNLALNKTYTVTPAPSATYPDTNGVELTDGSYGNLAYTDASWVGWQSVNPEIVIDLTSEQSFEFVSLYFLLSSAQSIYAPELVFVYGSNDNTNFTLLGKGHPFNQSGFINISASGTYRYVKFVINRYGYTDNTTNTNWTYISEIRIMDAYQTVNYELDDYTVFYAPLGGVAGVTTFTDVATNKTITTYGNTVVNAVSRHGRGSASFDGTGDYLLGTPSADFAFGTGDFCIEGFVDTYNGGATSWARLFETENNGTSGGINITRYNTESPTRISVQRSSDGLHLLDSDKFILNDEYQHLAVCRTSGVLYIFIDGVLCGSVACTENFTSQNFSIGANILGGEAWRGRIQDVRVSKGCGRYTSDFIPPKKPFQSSLINDFIYSDTLKFIATPEDDYPIKLILTATNFNYSECLSDYGDDIRFRDLSDNDLSYWIESWVDGGDSVIWVRIPTSGTTRIKMFWGSANAISESSPHAVNDWYDDMKGGKGKGRYLELTDPSPTSGPSNFQFLADRGIYIQKNNVYNATGGGQLRTRGLSDITCGIEALMSIKSVDNDRIGMMVCAQEAVEAQYYYAGVFAQDSKRHIDINSMNSKGQLTSKSVATSVSTVYPIKVEKYSSTINFYFNGSLDLTTTDSTYSQGEVGLGSSGNDEGQYILPLIVRKFDGIERSAIWDGIDERDKTLSLSAIQNKNDVINNVEVNRSIDILVLSSGTDVGSNDNPVYYELELAQTALALQAYADTLILGETGKTQPIFVVQGRSDFVTNCDSSKQQNILVNISPYVGLITDIYKSDGISSLNKFSWVEFRIQSKANFMLSKVHYYFISTTSVVLTIKDDNDNVIYTSNSLNTTGGKWCQFNNIDITLQQNAYYIFRFNFTTEIYLMRDVQRAPYDGTLHKIINSTVSSGTYTNETPYLGISSSNYANPVNRNEINKVQDLSCVQTLSELYTPASGFYYETNRTQNIYVDVTGLDVANFVEESVEFLLCVQTINEDYNGGSAISELNIVQNITINQTEFDSQIKQDDETNKSQTIVVSQSITYPNAYHIERKDGVSGEWVEIAIVEDVSTYQDDYNLVDGTTYYYRVRENRDGVFLHYTEEESILYDAGNEEYIETDKVQIVLVSGIRTDISVRLESTSEVIVVSQNENDIVVRVDNTTENITVSSNVNSNQNYVENQNQNICVSQEKSDIANSIENKQQIITSSQSVVDISILSELNKIQTISLVQNESDTQNYLFDEVNKIQNILVSQTKDDDIIGVEVNRNQTIAVNQTKLDIQTNIEINHNQVVEVAQNKLDVANFIDNRNQFIAIIHEEDDLFGDEERLNQLIIINNNQSDNLSGLENRTDNIRVLFNNTDVLNIINDYSQIIEVINISNDNVVIFENRTQNINIQQTENDTTESPIESLNQNILTSQLGTDIQYHIENHSEIVNIIQIKVDSINSQYSENVEQSISTIATITDIKTNIEINKTENILVISNGLDIKINIEILNQTISIAQIKSEQQQYNELNKNQLINIIQNNLNNIIIIEDVLDIISVVQNNFDGLLYHDTINEVIDISQINNDILTINDINKTNIISVSQNINDIQNCFNINNNQTIIAIQMESDGWVYYNEVLTQNIDIIQTLSDDKFYGEKNLSQIIIVKQTYNYLLRIHNPPSEVALIGSCSNINLVGSTSNYSIVYIVNNKINLTGQLKDPLTIVGIVYDPINVRGDI